MSAVEIPVTAPARTSDGSRRVRLLDVHPDLGIDLTDAERPRAARAIRCPLVELEPGAFNPADTLSVDQRGAAFAYMVIDGLIAREVILGRDVSISLYGPRDLIGAHELAGSTPTTASTFRALTPVRIAILDNHFLACVQRWPRLAARIMESAVEQIGRGCVRQAISQMSRADHRLLAVLWMLADAWGRVTPEGIVLDLPLTHEALGRLTGSRRPTVSLALRDLVQAGALQRRPRTGWLLAPASLEVLAGTPAA